MANVALVTGAASGIGQSCAIELAKHEYDLLLWDVDSKGLAETVQLVKSARASIKTSTNVVDVSDPDGVHAAVEQANSTGFKITAVVAAAGIVRFDSLFHSKVQDAALVMKVNYEGVVNTLRASYANVVAAKGAIVIIGSTESYMGGGAIHAYCASKHAVLGIGRAAAIELGPLGVRVNVVCPGTIKTPMYKPEDFGDAGIAMDKELQAKTPLKRLGTPEEIAKVVRFLLSEDASYVTGASIVVDGGLTT